MRMRVLVRRQGSKKVWVGLLLCVGLVSWNLGLALPTRERELLTLIQTELNVLSQVVQIAEKSSPKNQRVQFDTPRLLQDIRNIQDGLYHYLERPDPTPRTIEPLSGDYTLFPAGARSHDSHTFSQ